MLADSTGLTIILVEDDPGHARLIEKNLRRSSVLNELVILRDGGEALDYMFAEGDHIARRLPEKLLILLDLNLPVLSGYQVLERLRSDERTKYIPVIILTTTDDRAEIDRCYDLGCSVFVTKPVDYSQFADAIRKLGLFLSVVNVPVSKLGTMPA